MSTIHEPPEQRFLLRDVSWRSYGQLLRALTGRPGVRVTYDRGTLELITPSHEHESLCYLLARLIDAMTEELGLPVKGGRSTTFRRKNRRRGLEPDACWWIANEPVVRGKTEIDLSIDPPPDLAVEVDITHSSLDRLAIYAMLGVAEVWRIENEKLICYRLGPDGCYAPSITSQAFAGLEVSRLSDFLARRGQTDQTTIVREFRAWVRSQRWTEKTSD